MGSEKFKADYHTSLLSKTERDLSDMEKRELLIIYEGVCKAQDAKNREPALFGCLEIPNDNVRLATVDCLFNVPLD